jgi:hypothetical protein
LIETRVAAFWIHFRKRFEDVRIDLVHRVGVGTIQLQMADVMKERRSTPSSHQVVVAANS